jgi:hypothetical protein
MANREACEVLIEQEIKEALAQGKKPYSIGKEISKWVEKLFEANINPRTIEQRVRRIDDATNVAEKSQHTETITNSTPSIIENKRPVIIENRKPQGGGKREGAGRPKVVVEPVSDAWTYSQMAISQLDRIRTCDHHRTDALNQVIEYCENRKEKGE